jgi:hypothetical protein
MTVHRSVRRRIPEDFNPSQHRCEKPKSLKLCVLLYKIYIRLYPLYPKIPSYCRVKRQCSPSDTMPVFLRLVKLHKTYFKYSHDAAEVSKYDVFVKCNWVDTRWQLYSTHLHTNIEQKNTMKQNTQNGTYITIRIYKHNNKNK